MFSWMPALVDQIAWEKVANDHVKMECSLCRSRLHQGHDLHRIPDKQNHELGKHCDGVDVLSGRVHDMRHDSLPHFLEFMFRDFD